ncbi:MAG: glycoside hydrolase family 2 protein [Planctomycetota bacterium]
MNVIDLCGDWNVTQRNGDHSINGTVPGVVQLDLLARGIIKDPHIGYGDLETRWIAESEWDYKKTINVPADVLKRNAVELIFDGLDTVAEIFVNGQLLGATDNMFRQYRFDAKNLLKPGANEILVRFASSIKASQDLAAVRPYPLPIITHPQIIPHINLLRKCPAHFGWDWGPALAAVGMWKPARIAAYDAFTLDDATFVQVHDVAPSSETRGIYDIRKEWTEPHDVVVMATVFVTAVKPCAGTLTATLAGETVRMDVNLKPGENAIPVQVDVTKPDLWYPLGYGERPLYSLGISLTIEGETQTLEKSVGFREVEIVTENDGAGETFFFRVNGIPVYIKGSNWIPDDSFDNRIDKVRLERQLQSAADANMNCIRVWGGGVYESDAFYAICDRLGILVWQEFMFSCALYPGEKPFLDNVEIEARQQVRRLMSHPSIALWCGNNELDQIFIWNNRNTGDGQRYLIDYYKLFYQTIGRVLNEEDAGRSYWPSSASNGFDKWGWPQDPTVGDVHYWDVWHGGKPLEEYRNVRARFVSEFGFQSFPSIETLRPCLPETDFNVTAPNMEHRQRSNHAGNNSIIQHAARQFRMPVSFEGYIYQSQVLQALSIRTAVEAWRRYKPYCMGAIYWQINDIWQGPSWSSLEYLGRWKLLHYAAKRFFEPLLLSALEKDGRLEWHLTSDIVRPLTGTLTMDLWTWTGKKIKTLTSAASVDTLGSVEIRRDTIADLLGDYKPSEVLAFGRFVSNDGAVSAESEFFFSALKNAELPTAAITVKASQRDSKTIQLSVTSDQFAPWTMLSSPLAGRFSDNGLLLFPGDVRTLDFYAWEPLGDAAAFAKSLTITTMRGSYSAD